MRLSDIKGDRVFDVIADIIAPACNIASDPVASRALTKEVPPEGVPVREFAATKAKECIPTLLRDHKPDLIAIFAALNGVTPEEYREGLTMATLIHDVAEMFMDEDLSAFLSSADRTDPEG